MRLLASVLKDWLVLSRDRAGLAILFLMPTIMVVIMAIVQDAPFRDYQEHQLELLILDLDKGPISNALISGLDSTEAFKVIRSEQTVGPDEVALTNAVNEGKYQIGLVLDKGLSDEMDESVEQQIQALLGVGSTPVKQTNIEELPKITIVLDPATKRTFRTTIRIALRRFLDQIEGKMLLEELAASMSELTGSEQSVPPRIQSMIALEERVAGIEVTEGSVPSNSTQHNVPAWTVFAIFFIVLPITGNIVRERTSGTYMRLRTMSVPMAFFHGGKLVSFSLVSLAQTLLIILIGLLLLPAFGLERLQLGSGAFPLFIATISIGVAATSFGLLVGSIFHTHQQATVFGVVCVVIMAAMGGIWVPLYVMPDSMQQIGGLSPMNWSLESFNMVFLRGSSALEVLSGTYKLWIFSLVCIAGTLLISRRAA